MSKRDAEVTVGADATAAERAFGALRAAAKDLGDSIRSSIGGAAQSTITSLGDVAIAQGKVNFSAQHAQVREFEASTARLAIAMGRDLEGVRSSLENTGKAIGKRPQEVAAWASEVGKLTYNFQGASEAIRGMSALAAKTGRGVEEYRGLAVELGTVGKVAGDTSHAIGVMSAQAEQLGVSGGVAAFADQVGGLQDVISHFAVSSERDFLKVTALAGELGRGLSPQAAGRVQQGAFSAVANDPLRWERYLGHGIQDKQGHVKDPVQVMKEITEKTKRRYGKDAERVLQLNFGAETGAAMFNANYATAAKAAGLAPSTKPADAQGAYLATDAGRRQVAEATLSESSRHLMGSSTALGRAADALQKFSASSPIAGTFAATAAGGLLNSVVGGLTKSVTGMVSGAGGTSALAMTLKAGGGLLGTVGLLAGAGAAGYGIGTLVDRGLGLSDRISGTGGHSRIKAESDRADIADTAALMQRVIKIRAENEARRSGGAAKVEAPVVKISVINSTGGPVEVAEQGRQSTAAGAQRLQSF